jgi:hypothetical protein
LVSKAFHEPALDVLWRSQTSILPLLKTFPVEVWTETGNPSTLVSLTGFYFSGGPHTCHSPSGGP